MAAVTGIAAATMLAGTATGVTGAIQERKAAKSQKKDIKQARAMEDAAAQAAAQEMASRRKEQQAGGYQSTLGNSQGTGA